MSDLLSRLRGHQAPDAPKDREKESWPFYTGPRDPKRLREGDGPDRRGCLVLEVDDRGRPVALTFGGHAVPFVITRVDQERAKAWRDHYTRGGGAEIKVREVVVLTPNGYGAS